jgi:hypothetical protein
MTLDIENEKKQYCLMRRACYGLASCEACQLPCVLKENNQNELENATVALYASFAKLKKAGVV